MNQSDKEYLSSLEKETVGDHVYFFSPDDKKYLSTFKKKIEDIQKSEWPKKWYQIGDSRELSEAKKIYKKEMDKIAERINLLRKEQQKENEVSRYEQLRTDIEQMPIYEKWRQNVMEKCGNMCQICGTADNLEVHHRETVHGIVKSYGIKNVLDAIQCRALWDTGNGVVLCKKHHDQMESSKIYQKISQT